MVVAFLQIAVATLIIVVVGVLNVHAYRTGLVDFWAFAASMVAMVIFIVICFYQAHLKFLIYQQDQELRRHGTDDC